jgi:hypothetical protein
VLETALDGGQHGVAEPGIHDLILLLGPWIAGGGERLLGQLAAAMRL